MQTSTKIVKEATAPATSEIGLTEGACKDVESAGGETRDRPTAAFHSSRAHATSAFKPDPLW